MASNITSQTLLLAADTGGVLRTSSKDLEKERMSNADPSAVREDERYEWKISWRNVIAFAYLYLGGLYGLFLVFTGGLQLRSFGWFVLVGIFAAEGITAGAHRLWAHKAYKAKWQLRVFLALLQATAFQNHIYEWVRDHRVHHKFTDTNADPHNAKRGFFFSHVGWLLVRKHPDVKIKGKTVDMSDLEKDWVVVWQRRTYFILMPMMCFVLPTMVPIWLFNEDPWASWYGNIFRYILSLNLTWLVNSAAHIWGVKPFEKDISAAENKYVGILAVGEGWHNYHHVFPWDYRTSELGKYSVNWTTGFIDFFAKIGWAYDLKTVPHDAVVRRAARTGDGSLRDASDPAHHMNLWGWGDSDMTPQDKMDVLVVAPKPRTD